MEQKSEQGEKATYLYFIYKQNLDYIFTQMVHSQKRYVGILTETYHSTKARTT